MELIKFIQYIVSFILLSPSLQCTDRNRHAEPNHIESLEDFHHVIALWGSWRNVGQCSVSCGGQGFITRVRNCSTGIRHDCLDAGGDFYEVNVCNEPCVTGPTHWLEWTPTSECSASCDGGFQQSNRECSTGHNADCEAPGDRSWKIDICNQKPCSPIITTTTISPKTTKTPPSWSEWQSVIACSTTCGPGFEERTRTCSSGNNDDCPGSDFEINVCNKRSCEVDGIWTQWTNWVTCSVTCGGGVSYRTRACFYPDPARKGKPCSGDSAETNDCNTNICPVAGIWATWTAWGDCSKSCDRGSQTRVRACVFSPTAPHGLNCSGDSKETQPCQIAVCSADGQWSNWTSWTVCTLSCGGGQQYRERQCSYPDNTLHGQYCPGLRNETQDCNIQHCPVDGHWSYWTQWSSCSVTCATGNITRSRTCSNPAPANGGQQCNGRGEDSDACNLPKCPMWSSWFSGTCSVTCGQGHQTRVRRCSTGNSADCDGPAFENATCNASPCSVDGHWSEWSTWSSCDVTCASGHTHRTRNCSNPKPLYGGSDCQGDNVDTKSCTLQNCPTWSQWFTGECSVTCGDGSASLLRMCSTGKESDCSGTPFDSVACHKPAC